jgi:hypothetical protein
MRLPLTFEIPYTLEDHRAAQRFLIRRGMRKQRAARMLVAVSLVAGYLGLAFMRPRIVRSTGFAIGMGMFFGLIAVLVLLSRRLCLPAEGGAFLRTHRFEFGDDVIRVASTDREGFTGWTCVRSWSATSSHIFLVIDENAAITIPRRCFGGRNEEEELRELIRVKTGLEAAA